MDFSKKLKDGILSEKISRRKQQLKEEVRSLGMGKKTRDEEPS